MNPNFLVSMFLYKQFENVYNTAEQALWCSGSIQDSGSWDPSSNLGGAESFFFFLLAKCCVNLEFVLQTLRLNTGNHQSQPFKDRPGKKKLKSSSESTTKKKELCFCFVLFYLGPLASAKKLGLVYNLGDGPMICQSSASSGYLWRHSSM